MKIKVTKADIEKGRAHAEDKCGCPIWYALNRELGLGLTVVDTTVLCVRKMDEAYVRNLMLALPAAAVEMQRILRNCPNAQIAPFVFEAVVSHYQG